VITVEISKTDADPGQSNGTLVVTASGPSKYFTYSLNNLDFQASNKFTNLDSGKYKVTVKNSWGCIGSGEIKINKINPCAGVTLTATPTAATLGISNGKIVCVVTGSTGYTFSLNGGAFQSGSTFSNLAAGNYTVTAKNSSGCLFTSQTTIAANDPCAGVTVVVTATSVNPVGTQSNGSITVTATGASGFTYSLNSGAFQSGNIFTGLISGNYSIRAKSSAGCIGTTQVALGATNPCAGVTVSVTGLVTDASAGLSNGNIVAAATGGAGFTFSLNSGSYQTNGTFSNLGAGNYTITAKNSNGCLGSASFTIASVNPCTGLTLSIATTITPSANCVTTGTGSISATASGSSGFTYNLNNGAYQSGNTFTALLAGTYTIGAKDVNGCTKSVTATVGVTPAGPTYAAVKILIQSRCSGSGCHTNGQSQKGYNFDTDCNIVKAWSGINGSTITGTLNRMPISPQPNLTASEKQIIIDWINAGHGFAN
jgi:hypothetical protein